MNLRDILAEHMRLRKWNAYDLAEVSGVPQPTIQRFLSGKHTDLRSETVRKLAAGLGLSEARLRGLDAVVPSALPALSPSPSGTRPDPSSISPGPPPPGPRPGPITLTDLLDALAERLAKADPNVREEVARLMLRYLDNPSAGARIAQAIELLLSQDAHPAP